jgi:YesN/AraC family two-component response regulator
MAEQADEWNMVFAANGSEALDIMSSQTVNVVVTDIAMPVMDGETLISRLYDGFPDVVPLVLSGHWTAAMSQRKVGPSIRFLAKPIGKEDLVTALREAVAEARLTTYSQSPGTVSPLDRAAQPRSDETSWVNRVNRDE